MVDFLYTFLLIQGIQWYALSIVCLLSTFYFINFDYPIRSTLGLFASIALLQLTPLQPYQLITQHPLTAVEYFLAYLGIGLVYVVVRWICHVFYVSRKVNRIKDLTFSHLMNEIKSNATYFNEVNNPNISTLNNNGKELFYSKLAYRLGLQKTLPLQVSQHTSEMYIWWTAWPLCIVWSVIHSIQLWRVWNVLFELIHKPLQHISNKFFELS